MREVHTALIKARLTRQNDGWTTVNELVWMIYPEPNTWQYRERQRFAVRKAITALRRDRVEGVWILKEGEGSDERVRADLTKWTNRYLKTPRHRIRQTAHRPAAAKTTTDDELTTYRTDRNDSLLRGPCRKCKGCPGYWPEEDRSDGRCIECLCPRNRHKPVI